MTSKLLPPGIIPNVDDGLQQVSRGGGTRPLWARDGSELFYLAPGGQLMSVFVGDDPSLDFGNPRSSWKNHTLPLLVAALASYNSTAFEKTPRIMSARSRENRSDGYGQAMAPEPSYLDNIESSIVEVVCRSLFGSSPSLSRVQDRVVRKRRELSWYARIPCTIFLILYDALHFLFLTRSYSLPFRRRHQIWHFLSRLPLLGNFRLYYESVCVYFFFAASGDRHPPAPMDRRPLPAHAKVVVVGSGPGGAVVAYNLAKSGVEVLVLEEGHGVCESPGRLAPEHADRHCRGGGVTVTFGNVNMNFVEGRCLGGGSEVSGGLYYRTPPQVLARWQEDYRVDDVVPSSLEPHFANCEQILRIDYVEDCFNQAKNILERGAAALGWNVTKVKSCHFVDESGRIRRTSAGTSFMRLGRELGAMIHTGVRVRRISRENRVYELHCAIDGRVQTVRCETVFVCAGATQTPLLLMRSGVTKNVGRALRFQPIVKLVAEFEEEVNSGTARMPPYHIRNSDSRFMLGSSVSTPDQVALNLLPYPEVLTTIEDRWKRMLIFHIGITSTSAGRIIAVGDQTEPLVLYHASSEDVEKLNDGLSKMSRLLLHAGAKSIYVNGRGMEPIHDMHQVPNDYQRRQLNLFCYHLSSSCPMGEKEEICAVDSFGRVEKDGNVIVSDSSVLCTSPSVNPQGTILAIARRNVLRFLDRA